jgi:hypothetical protein
MPSLYNSGTNRTEITAPNGSSVVRLPVATETRVNEPLSSNGRLLQCFHDCTLPAFRLHVTIFCGLTTTSEMWAIACMSAI